MKTYRFTVRRTFTAHDDVEAREIVGDMLDNTHQFLRFSEKEVHEVFESKEPRKLLPRGQTVTVI